MSETISPNSTIAQYTIVSKMGEDGMGEVWRARDSKPGRDVAIKVLPAALSADKDRLARFEQEAQAAGGLNHPNILVIYHIGTHDRAPYIVSELLEGEELRERLNNGSIPLRRIIDFAQQIVSGLCAAHEKGIVHRDLKPENLFVTKLNRWARQLTLMKWFKPFALLLLASSSLAQSVAPKSAAKLPTQKRFEIRVNSFLDLYFYVYKLASSDQKLPSIDGLAQAIEAARQVPMNQPLIDLRLFSCRNAADAERAFSEFSESFTTRQGTVIPLRQRAVQLARSMAKIERPFMDTIWPQHKRSIEAAQARISQTLEPKQEECFTYLTSHLGMETANYTVPVYLVAEMPAFPSALTATGKETNHGVCVLNTMASQGSGLFSALLHEAIHALDAETSGSGNVLIEFQNLLLKARFDKNDFVFRNAPHFLVFIQSVETVRRFLDSSYQPYDQGVFVRPGLVPLVSVEKPVWIDYLDGKLSRVEALTMMVDAFVKARKEEAPAKAPLQGSGLAAQRSVKFNRFRASLMAGS